MFEKNRIKKKVQSIELCFLKSISDISYVRKYVGLNGKGDANEHSLFHFYSIKHPRKENTARINPY